jgi:hypothetical protein
MSVSASQVDRNKWMSNIKQFSRLHCHRNYGRETLIREISNRIFHLQKHRIAIAKNVLKNKRDDISVSASLNSLIALQ